MARNIKSNTPKRGPACLVFTSETVDITREAIARLERMLERTPPLDSKTAFAVEVVQQIKGKLEMMSMLERELLIPFDHNEKILLVAALQMYGVDLGRMPPGPERKRKWEQCRQMMAYFAPERQSQKKRR